MHKNIAAGILFIILLTGCVTTQEGQGIQAQELQTRVNYLELELKKHKVKTRKKDKRKVRNDKEYTVELV